MPLIQMHSGPRWFHDCEFCKFAGRYDGADVYLHDRGTMIEVVIRNSNENSHYWSGSVVK